MEITPKGIIQERKQPSLEDLTNAILEKIQRRFGTDVDLSIGQINQFDVSERDGFEKARKKMAGGNCRETAQIITQILKESSEKAIQYTLSIHREREGDRLEYRLSNNRGIESQLISNTEPMRHAFCVWERNGEIFVLDPTIFTQIEKGEREKISIEDFMFPLEEYLQGFFVVNKQGVSQLDTKSIIQDVKRLLTTNDSQSH